MTSPIRRRFKLLKAEGPLLVVHKPHESGIGSYPIEEAHFVKPYNQADWKRNHIADQIQIQTRNGFRFEISNGDLWQDLTNGNFAIYQTDFDSAKRRQSNG